MGAGWPELFSELENKKVPCCDTTLRRSLVAETTNPMRFPNLFDKPRVALFLAGRNQQADLTVRGNVSQG